MGQVLQIKRGLSANLGSLTLQEGELAVALDTGKVYIGDGKGNKILINPDAKALTAADIPALTLAKISDAGTAAKANTGTASGNVPVLNANGKLDSSLYEPIAITDTFVVASEAAMLALSGAETGDVAVRTDLNKSFILKAKPYSTLANWQELLTPASPVQSVNGKTGAVTLSASDVSAEPAVTADTVSKFWSGTKTWRDLATDVRAVVLTGLSTATSTAVAATDTVLAAIGKLQAQITLRAPLASPALTGTPTAPTAAAGTNTTQIATTAFVTSQGFINSNSVIDLGTF